MPKIEFLTVSEAAAECRVCSRTIRNWIKSGQLKAGRFRSHYRIAREDLEELIANSWLEVEKISRNTKGKPHLRENITQ